ncbi:MAG: hypothetical protein VW333_11135, partial [Pseudomonadales bacterium]
LAFDWLGSMIRWIFGQNRKQVLGPERVIERRLMRRRQALVARSALLFTAQSIVTWICLLSKALQARWSTH